MVASSLTFPLRVGQVVSLTLPQRVGHVVSLGVRALVRTLQANGTSVDGTRRALRQGRWCHDRKDGRHRQRS
jgi:hypothetical protein